MAKPRTFDPATLPQINDPSLFPDYARLDARLTELQQQLSAAEIEEQDAMEAVRSARAQNPRLLVAESTEAGELVDFGSQENPHAMAHTVGLELKRTTDSLAAIQRRTRVLREAVQMQKTVVKQAHAEAAARLNKIARPTGYALAERVARATIELARADEAMGRFWSVLEAQGVYGGMSVSATGPVINPNVTPIVRFPDLGVFRDPDSRIANLLREWRSQGLDIDGYLAAATE